MGRSSLTIYEQLDELYQKIEKLEFNCIQVNRRNVEINERLAGISKVIEISSVPMEVKHERTKGLQKGASVI